MKKSLIETSILIFKTRLTISGDAKGQRWDTGQGWATVQLDVQIKSSKSGQSSRKIVHEADVRWTHVIWAHAGSSSDAACPGTDAEDSTVTSSTVWVCLHQSKLQARLSLGSLFTVPFLAMNCSVHKLPYGFVRTLLGIETTLKLGNSEFRVLKNKIQSSKFED